ncbi:protein yippee-like 3 isoform X1 [Heterocephalus glaber]|uniref:Protein yippee-like 3 isoform X1 n=1 Tax=Heterocephalus glaber TaxID=10181 RepID=A0AAX6R757_HETGA|nr:protein yippee-like 3 isoform X1 [Heterocephalus glaber]
MGEGRSLRLCPPRVCIPTPSSSSTRGSARAPQQAEGTGRLGSRISGPDAAGGGGWAARPYAGRRVTRPLICMPRADWPRRPPGREPDPSPSPSRRSRGAAGLGVNKSRRLRTGRGGGTAPTRSAPHSRTRPPRGPGPREPRRGTGLPLLPVGCSPRGATAPGPRHGADFKAQDVSGLLG